MKFTSKLLVASLLLTMGVQAQRNCGTQTPSAEWDAWFNQLVLEHQQNLTAGKTQSTNFTIPVVVHVIHGGQSVGTYPNISTAQINSQIVVLNSDFAGTGLNTNNLAATGFSAIGAADCSISFCLAQLDPDGNTLAEAGIDRINYVNKAWTNPASITSQASFQSYVDGTIKPNSIWDPKRYFNIWITDHHSNVDLLGYATFPSGSGLTGVGSSFGNANTDGIWVWSKSFGNTGVLSPPYHRGRTATHETGHWLGLRHIGGDGNNNVNGDCNATDYCADTPPQKGGFSGGQYGQNFGAPTYPLHLGVCSASTYGDMFMNFMDYTDDMFCYMFSPNQSTRMTTAMTNGTYRNQLTASSATMCNVIAATMPVANFALAAAGCVDTVITTNNQSSGTPTPTYSWSILPNPGGVFTPNNSAVSPNLIFSSAGIYTVTVYATNSAGTTTSAKVINIQSCTTVGVKNTSWLQNNIILSPNPSTGIVNIHSTSVENQNIEVEIHNYIGQHITSANYKDVNANKAMLDMSSYPNGVYFITISNGHEKTVKRLILNK